MVKKKVPFIEQMNQTECGIACISMISAYYENHISLFKIREEIGNGRDGNSLMEILHIAKHLNFDARWVKCKPTALTSISLPAILYWDNKHYVVIEKIKNDKYYILDPSDRRKSLSQSEFNKYFTGYVLQLKPNNNFEKNKPDSLWKPYIKLILKKPKILITFFMLSLLLQLFALVTPTLTQKIIDDMLLTDGQNLVFLFLQGIIISLGLYFIFNLLRNEVSIRLYRFIDYELSWEYFSHLLKVPYNFFQVRQSGDLLYRASILRTIRHILSNQIMKGLLDILLVIVIFFYMLIKSPFLTFWLVLFSVALYIFILAMRPFITEANSNELSRDTEVYSYQSETILGILDVKISGSENSAENKWKDLYSEFMKAFMKKERLVNVINSFSGSLTYFIPLLIILIGANKVFNGSISIGELIAFQGIATYFIGTVNSLIFSMDSFFQLKVYLRRVRDVIDTPTEMNSDINYKKIDLQGKIQLKNVSFSYTKFSKKVLDNINLNIEPGQKIAIIGPSGSGKSTLAKILVGLHNPTEGEISYDDIEFNILDKPYLRKQMGIVTQSPFLFNASILHNLKLNNENLTKEQVEQAAKVAQIHNEIMEMPMKYETLISEMGQNLSGGQKQRISIARAIVHSPKIIVLDEATNSLDSINESRIDKYLSEMNCTRIVIAHRLATVKNADHIIILEDGKIVDQGNHQQLLKHSKIYQELFKSNENLDLKGGDNYDEGIKSIEKSIL